MKLPAAILCGLALSGAPGATHAEPPMAGSIDLMKTARWFAEFDSLCAHDGGKLWGATFCGPILFVDPTSRAVAANRAGAAQTLVPRAGVFTGELPAGLPVANTAVEWEGTRWTMILWWSLSEKQRPRLSLIGHESFHRLQPQLGLEASGELNDHLDSAGGRFWMQMEWNALQQALLADADARRAAIADALAFRATRRAEFPNAAAREIPLEINEGLAEYSGRRLVGYSNAEIVKIAIAKREAETGFVRSFAYVSGPLYGFLLDSTGEEWRQQVTPKSDLGDLLATAMHLQPAPPGPAPDAAKRAVAYGGAELRAAEDERDRKRQTQLAAWRAALVDGPVLIVDLAAVKSGSFDPGKVFPMGEKQTVYTTRELEAEWGLLTVTGGAILEDANTGEGHVSLAGATADYTQGSGWALKLAAGWHITPGVRAGDLEVTKR